MENVNNSKDKEIWKEIQGFEGLYSVSNRGRVMSLKTGRILSDRYDRYGYRVVTLKKKPYTIHRLVALAFIPNPNKLPEVNHIDEKKDNNNVENLEWCSKSYNVRHSIHNQSCKVKQLDKNGNLIRIWPSLRQINRELGYSTQPILNTCKGRQEYSHNFKWEYMDPSSQRNYNRQVIVHKGSEYIGTFASTAKASEALGLKYSSINDCLRGRKDTNKGYTFSYK